MEKGGRMNHSGCQLKNGKLPPRDLAHHAPRGQPEPQRRAPRPPRRPRRGLCRTSRPPTPAIRAITAKIARAKSGHRAFARSMAMLVLALATAREAAHGGRPRAHTPPGSNPPRCVALRIPACFRAPTSRALSASTDRARSHDYTCQGRRRRRPHRTAPSGHGQGQPRARRERQTRTWCKDADARSQMRETEQDKRAAR